MNCPNCGEVYKKAPLVCLKCNSILAGSLHLNKETAVATQPLSQDVDLFENLKNFVENSPDRLNTPKQSANNRHQSIRSFAKYYPTNDRPAVEAEENIQARVAPPTSPIQRLDRTTVAVRQTSPTEKLAENNRSDEAINSDEMSASSDVVAADLKDHPNTKKALDRNQMLNVIVISAYVITIIFFLIYLFGNTSG